MWLSAVSRRIPALDRRKLARRDSFGDLEQRQARRGRAAARRASLRSDARIGLPAAPRSEHALAAAARPGCRARTSSRAGSHGPGQLPAARRFGEAELAVVGRVADQHLRQRRAPDRARRRACAAISARPKPWPCRSGRIATGPTMISGCARPSGVGQRDRPGLDRADQRIRRRRARRSSAPAASRCPARIA